jgi:predicted Fe-Mo cluster-binding NifX family protein
VEEDAGLDSPISPHFGKAPGFLLAAADGGSCVFIDAVAARREGECAPLAALLERGCGTVLCRSMGRGALRRARQAGLRVLYAGPWRTAREALCGLAAGRCPEFSEDRLCGHH